MQGKTGLSVILFLSCLTAEVPTYAQQSDGGLGITVGQLYNANSENNRGYLVVIYVPQGSPAQTNGVRAGDFITHINGKPVAGRNIETLVKELKGPVGSWVRLKIERLPNRQIIDVGIPRLAIPAGKSP